MDYHEITLVRTNQRGLAPAKPLCCIIRIHSLYSYNSYIGIMVYYETFYEYLEDVYP